MKIWNKYDGTTITGDIKFDDRLKIYHLKFKTSEIDCETLYFQEQGWEEIKECTIVSLINYLEEKRDKRLSYPEFDKIDEAWWKNDWETIINLIKKALQ